MLWYFKRTTLYVIRHTTFKERRQPAHAADLQLVPPGDPAGNDAPRRAAALDASIGGTSACFADGRRAGLRATAGGGVHCCARRVGSACISGIINAPTA